MPKDKKKGLKQKQKQKQTQTVIINLADKAKRRRRRRTTVAKKADETGIITRTILQPAQTIYLNAPATQPLTEPLKIDTISEAKIKTESPILEQLKQKVEKPVEEQISLPVLSQITTPLGEKSITDETKIKRDETNRKRRERYAKDREARMKLNPFKQEQPAQVMESPKSEIRIKQPRLYYDVESEYSAFSDVDKLQLRRQYNPFRDVMSDAA